MAKSLELVPEFTHIQGTRIKTLNNQVETDAHFWRVVEISRDELPSGMVSPPLLTTQSEPGVAALA